jgi:hypothetical protein
MKKTYVLIIFLLIMVFFFIIIAFITSSGKKTGNVPIPTNNIVAPINTGTAVPNSIPTNIPSDYPKNTTTISKLIENLPHAGINFYLSYNYSDDSFLLLLSSSKSASGEAELETFLKQNGVLDRSWLKNLTLSYQ